MCVCMGVCVCLCVQIYAKIQKGVFVWNDVSNETFGIRVVRCRHDFPDLLIDFFPLSFSLVQKKLG